MRRPPASTTATLILMSSSSALAMAAAIIRLLSASVNAIFDCLLIVFCLSAGGDRRGRRRAAT